MNYLFLLLIILLFLLALSLVTCHLSLVTCHLSLVTCHLSLVTCHLSLVTCHLSLVTCHLSLVTCHLSLVTCHLFEGYQPCQISFGSSLFNRDLFPKSLSYSSAACLLDQFSLIICPEPFLIASKQRPQISSVISPAFCLVQFVRST